MKNRKNLTGIIIIQVVLCIFFSKSYALDPKTHRALNKYIADNTINDFSLDSFLRNQLGFQKGREESFNSLEVWEWLREGGEHEDKPPGAIIPYIRSFNHFHNPLTDKGYKGIGVSSIQWSQRPQETQTPQGYYSWHDVRDYFYNALIATDKTTRGENFADTFRGLGQLMHLVQDLSVPSHTRDDGHLLYNYEKWAKKNIRYDEISNYKPFMSFDKSVIGNTNSQASVPVANLFDTDQYVNPSPDPSITLESDIGLSEIGLSEYANANFLSLDTMFTSGFPYPKWDECLPHRDGNNGREYLESNGSGEKVKHLAVTSFLHYIRYKFFPWVPTYNPVGLDDLCYEDYAKKLIPRAVGYSAGLLDYFFRGKMNLIENPDIPCGLIIENKSEEEMKNGTFRLYYDNKSKQRVEVPTENGGFPYTASISAKGKSGNIKFTPPNDADEPGKYILVFKGTLGNEETDAVVGKVVDGLKPSCQYLLLTAVSFGSGNWYTVWDVVAGTVADIKWDGKDLKLPMEADLTDSEDPLYQWLMSRPWDKDVPEEDRTGLPAVQTEQGLSYVAIGAAPTMSGYNLPEANSTDCLVSCGDFQPPGNPTDSCSGFDSDSVAARGEFNSVYGLTNDESLTDTWSCSNTGAPVPITAIENRTLRYQRSLAALFSASENNCDISSTGPFTSRGVARVGDEENLIADALVLQTINYTRNDVLDANITYTCDTHDCSGHRTNTYLEEYEYEFQTPLGSLDTINTSGSRTVVATPYAIYMCSISQWTYETTFKGVGAISSDIEWGGLGTQKNQMMCFYSPKVMFQTYYYSTRIGYQCPPGSPVQWTDNFTDVAASVEYYPDGDAGDADPLEMDPTATFESAITDLFEAAMGDSTAPDDSIRHFNISVYN